MPREPKRLDYDELQDLRQQASKNDHLRTWGPVSFSKALGADDDGPGHEVKCAGGCGVELVMSGFAWEVGKILVRYWIASGHSPITENDLLRCAACQAKEDERRERRDREVERRVGEVIKRAREDDHGSPDSRTIQDLRALRENGFGREASWIEEIYRRRREEQAGEGQAGAGRRKSRYGGGRRGLDDTVA